MAVYFVLQLHDRQNRQKSMIFGSFNVLTCLFVLLLSDSKAELQLFRIPLTLAKMNKAKSILFPYMEVNVCTH